MAAETARDNWFHGKISRETAEHILLSSKRRREGLFLVRERPNEPGTYALSLFARGQAKHYQIQHMGDYHYAIDDGPVFQGIDELVRHYCDKADGLPTRLFDFCPGNVPPAAIRKRYETDLHRAAYDGGDIQRVSRLCREMAPEQLNARNPSGATPLFLAASRGHADTVGALVRASADVKVRDNSGTTPLQAACMNGHGDVCRSLIQLGRAEVQDRNSSTGWVALHEAAFRGHLDCVRALLELGAPLNPRTRDGDTPKVLASRYGRHKVASFLETYRISPAPTKRSEWLHPSNVDRKTAIELLRAYGLSDGLFLVRCKMTSRDLYAVSLALNSTIYHYEIQKKEPNLYFIDDGPYFTSLEHVIAHYMKRPDGLPTQLRTPISPQQGKVKPIPAPRPSNVPKPTASENPDEDDDDYSHADQWDKQSRAVDMTSGLGFDYLPAVTKVAPPLPASMRPPAPLPSSTPGQMSLINETAIKYDKELGQGAFGSVMKAFWTSPDGNIIDVAVKTLRTDQMGHGEQEFLREARVMINLHHACIVQLIGVSLGTPMMLVQELVPMGCLLDLLLDHPEKCAVLTLKLWAAQIANGMVYLEQKRFVHRDLAARNILVASLNQVKISDFGLSRAVGADSQYYKASKGGRWPIKWYAPESVNFGEFSHASDVWSYGITLWEMFSYGEQPYGDWTGTQTLNMIENSGYRLEKPDACPASAYGLMLSCWDIERDKRPTFLALYNIFLEDSEYGDIRKHEHFYA